MGSFINQSCKCFLNSISDLISRNDEHAHDICSDGNLVDLSLRSSFGQDQSASSFLRELIDLSSRSDTFHGEINLTNKPPQQQQQPLQAPTSAHSHPPTNPQPQQLHHTHSKSNNSSHHIHHASSQSHHHHHGHHHHVQNPNHQTNSSTANGVGLQNVIYQDAIFSLQN